MSYTGLKRVVGETHLERKCRMLFGACLLVLIAGSFWWYGNTTKKLVYEQNQLRGELLANTSLLQRHWKKLETNAQFKEMVVDELSRQLIGNQSDDAEAPDGNKPAAAGQETYDAAFIRPDGALVYLDDTVVLPDGTVLYSKENKAVSGGKRLPDGTLLRADGTPAPESVDAPRYAPIDEWERVALAKFLRERAPPNLQTQPGIDEGRWAERYRSSGDDTDDYYEFYKPIYALKGGQCVECHRVVTGPQDLDKGDVMALTRVRIYTDTQQKLSQNRAVMITAAIITVFLAMIVAYVIVRYVIVKPLKHLRNVSDAVSRGDIHQRADIHTGDEFEELAVAFNRMLRSLVAIQEELRQVNGSLDQKVDELAQVNMQLFEMNRLKSDFLATMSHELRTPLNSIIGFSDVLGSIDSLDDKQLRYVKNIQASGRVLLDMINDILDLAKIESGKMDVRPTEFSIAHVIAAQCDMARPLTERRNIDLATDVDPHLPPLFQDQSKVQQILNNLLSNAIKFTPEGGRIHVAAHRDRHGFLNLVVSDTGVGIAEEDRTRIFEKFRQGASALAGGDAITREHSGTGLGLSIVKELCRLLGGEVLLESEVGKGSTFTVHIPWRLDATAHPEPAQGGLAGDLTRGPALDYQTLIRPAATGAE